MIDQVLIIGGQGRIGRCVAADLLAHTPAEITITGRTVTSGTDFSKEHGPRMRFAVLELTNHQALAQAVRGVDLVIHCAGPFAYRDVDVLKVCIEAGADYLDVSDDRAFTKKALALRSEAERAGVTAVVNTGIFPGISNSLVREGAEALDAPEEIHLSYVVQGSGGAGITVMRTTFLALQKPFEAWIDGNWRKVRPYTEPEVVDLGGSEARVYWFDMPESYTLSQTFPVKTVVTKFGVSPDFYNQMTWLTANWFPKDWLHNSDLIEFLAQVSHGMTSVTDRFSGIGVTMHSAVTGLLQGKRTRYIARMFHPNTAVACGFGTGSIAEFVLSGELKKPGVWTVDEALPTELFHKAEASRAMEIQRSQDWL